MIRIVFMLIIMMMFACGRGSHEKFVYDEDGRILKKYEYLNRNDTSSYLLKKYYDNGNIHYMVTSINGLAEGILYVYDMDGKLDLTRRYEKAKLHGVSKIYNLFTGQLYQEELFVNDHKVLLAEYFRHVVEGDTIYGLGYWYKTPTESDTTLFPVGSIVWDKSGKRIPLMNTYYEVFAEDTIPFGKEYKVKILFRMGVLEDITISLQLGELDENLNYINPHNTDIFQSEGDSLILHLSDYKIGSNLILGKIKLFHEGRDITSQKIEHLQIKEYIFYHQFEVVE